MDEWPSTSEMYEDKVFPRMTFNSQNQAHIAQQSRREKLRIPGIQPPLSPQRDEDSNHTSGSRSSMGLPQRPPEPKRAKTSSEFSFSSGFENVSAGSMLPNAMNDVCQVYNTDVISSSSFNFPTGAELLAVSARKMTPAMTLAGSVYGGQSLYPGDISSQVNRSSNPSNWGLGLHGQMSQHGTGSFFVGTGPSNFQNAINNEHHAADPSAVEAILVGTNQLQSTGIGTRNKEMGMEPYIVSSNNQPEAVQLCGINLGYHGYPDSVQGNVVLMGRTPGGAMDGRQTVGGHQTHVAGIQLPANALAHGMFPHQATMSAVPIAEQAFPSNHLAPRLENQSSHSWQNGGNELLFLPMPGRAESNQAGTTHTNQTLEFGRPSAWTIPDYDMRHPLILQGQDHSFIQGEIGQGLHIEQSEDANTGQFQGLSLSLSSHQPSAMQLNSFQVQIPEAGLATNTHLLPHAVDEAKAKLAERFSNRFQVGLNPLQSSRDLLLTPSLQNEDRKVIASAKQFSYNHGLSSPSSNFRMLSSSRYLRVVQHLLDEVCSVGKDGNSSGSTDYKSHERMASKSSPYGSSRSEKTDVEPVKRDGTSFVATAAVSSISHCAETATPLTQEERQQYQIRKTQLLSMLQEVDRQYRQYYDHMQAVIFSFDSAVGQVGAARPYTRLALKAMSRHFRCLRDTISNQIQITCKALGEEDISETGPLRKVTSRLRFVDQQLRQQRALQQLGMLQQPAWRPQRGLPEHSVSILRAWLFEHFLHPYPKDADKVMLARQTGLSRSQVSNWFINARVRLWKPMVEEMYLEENRENDHEASAKRVNQQTDDGISCEQNICENRDGDSRHHNGMVREESKHNQEDLESDGKVMAVGQRHQSGLDMGKSESDNVVRRNAHTEMTNAQPNVSGSNSGMLEGGSMNKEIITDISFRQNAHEAYNPGSLSSSMFDKSLHSRPKDTISDGYYQDGYKVGNSKRYSTYPFTVQNGNTFLHHSSASDTYTISDGNMNLYSHMDVSPKLFGNGGVSLTLGLQHADNLSQATSHNYVHSINNLTESDNPDDFHLDVINHTGGMHPDQLEGHESLNFQSRKRVATHLLHEFVA
ncbi:hypothetical protein O6H91_10G079400 [Diphasiastrum complanatum]|uniref:Uncharacterized protein n=4 Tax=Diphasiastrum complanatum TaxID=34168 RepID=A0ACC2CIR9_DIPCM|nr:hypothetical protein O6H91_10G079400 [Diphasiastrum complanatum]KAJ7541849.1 hypothetical protein O6H91_10G079400 [Diphasiastrum complanatum]KAJ7541850.1 hypothetical protein O6H91_10G079400 [Diphasiastrum complanatum]KAJ7541851.1 hypothetical protein O6H91_10G079400 [Diphasiastrum complanatum]